MVGCSGPGGPAVPCRMARVSNLIGLALAAVGASGLCGCRTPEAKAPTPRYLEPGPRGAFAHDCNVFAPAQIRIHPLTHVDAPRPDASGVVSGEARIVLHFELKDKYGDPVKWTGRLTVELYRPGQGIMPGMETQEVAWDLSDMQDADRNTGRFDQATRMYRVPLRAPAWVRDWATQQRKDPKWLRLRAVFAYATPDGKEALLEHEFIMQ